MIPMSSASADQCPQCSHVIELNILDYEPHIQKTSCPDGHAVWREWGGPENPGWDRAISPYGWSRWHLEKYR
jgi:hypothetical protein